MRSAGSLVTVALAAYVAGRRRGHHDGGTRMLRRLFDAGLVKGRS